ncbi:MAG: maleate cis-trans isomerase family protein [Burkholderiaceae bacterium]
MKRTLLGVLTPSSNTALEPLTSAMVAGLPGVSAHFGRFRVTEISLRAASTGQFDDAPILEAARLLADAHVDVIAWSGTSSGWLGFERDATLCEAITRETGVPACTSVLALNEVMTATGRRRFGLVTPYLDDVQARIVSTYAGAGFECVAERHTGQHVNFDFSEVDEPTLADMTRAVAAAGPDCITTFCTNLRAAHLVPALEAELGLPIYDTVSLAVWKSLRVCGLDTAAVRGWGRLFTEAMP